MRAFIKIFLLFFSLTQTPFAENVIVISALNLDQATNKIKSEKKSKVLGAKTEVIEGKQVHVIKVLTEDGRVQHHKVDAETGKITNK